MSQRPPSDDEWATPQRGVSSTEGCRYELEYVTVNEQSVHEPWLFEWVLDCIAIDDVVGISLSRHDGHRRSISIEIDTRSCDGLCVFDKRSQERMSELADRVDELVVSRHNGESVIPGGQ